MASQDQGGFCNKDVPHRTNSLVTLPPAKPEKVKRNHAVLVQWLETHHQNPYPTKAEKHYLACSANMTQRQLNDWFANARRNIKKVGFPMWKAKHTPNLNGGRSRHHSNMPAAVHSGGSTSGAGGSIACTLHKLHVPSYMILKLILYMIVVYDIMHDGCYTDSIMKSFTRVAFSYA